MRRHGRDRFGRERSRRDRLGGSRSAEPPTAARPCRPARRRDHQPAGRRGGNAGVIPAGFPLPPGTRVGPVAVGQGDHATLTVANGKQVYDYWRRRLPAAGYTISGSQMVGGIGEITFSGRDCGAGSQLGISDQDVTFECARG